MVKKIVNALYDMMSKPKLIEQRDKQIKHQGHLESLIKKGLTTDMDWMLEETKLKIEDLNKRIGE